MAVDAHVAGPDSYDLVLMNLQIPVMDGLEATKIITERKKELQTLYPMVCFLTAPALSDYQAKADEDGGDAFISKPFKIETIRDLSGITMICKKRSARVWVHTRCPA